MGRGYGGFQERERGHNGGEGNASSSSLQILTSLCIFDKNKIVHTHTELIIYYYTCRYQCWQGIHNWKPWEIFCLFIINVCITVEFTLQLILHAMKCLCAKYFCFFLHYSLICVQPCEKSCFNLGFIFTTKLVKKH